MEKIINIKDYLNRSMAVSTDRAELIFKECKKHIENGENIILNFDNTKLVITAFLNIVIGKLYGLGIDSNIIDNKISFINITPSINKMIMDVIKNSKKYYENKQNGLNPNNHLNRSIDGDL